MTIGPVQSDVPNGVISATPAIVRRDTSDNTEFANTLRTSTGLSSGSANLDSIFEEAGRIYNISPNLLKAVAKVESNFRPDAVSRVGAIGVMQLMPGTAAGLGVTDPYDPHQNIMGGANYLRQMLDRFDGNLQAALSAYNAGPGRVSRNGGQPLSFTEGYVAKVLNNFNGGNITAGSVAYNRSPSIGFQTTQDSTGNLSELLNKDAISQMLLMKIIEMQMSSSDDDDDKKIF